MKNNLPSISIIMPTLNAEKTLEMSLKSIKEQNYPKGKIEILILDGGSKDKTIEIAQKYGCKIFKNPLQTAEAGKAVGVKKAKGELIALIDSDNILPSKNWFLKMVKPFEDPEILGTEPFSYTYRKKDGYITRYCALMGMNDPLCYFLGNYDRENILSGQWTGLKVKTEKKTPNYLKIVLDPKNLPTIGANGTMLKRKLLLKYLGDSDYLFDIDIIYQLAVQGQNKFAKVKTGIRHLFSGNLSTFARKQKRRILDYNYYQKRGLRKYPWQKQNRKRLVKFILFCLLIFPLIGQSILGYIKKRDVVWFFHPLACWITLIVYGIGFIKKRFKVEIASREKWRQ